MDGVGLRRNAWRPLLESDEGIELLTPIMAFLHDENGNPLIEVEPDELAELRKVAIDLIVPSVQAINSYWKAHRHPIPRASKTGRNDPCPCGSGRKYKRCCVRKLAWRSPRRRGQGSDVRRPTPRQAAQDRGSVLPAWPPQRRRVRSAKPRSVRHRP